MSDEKTDKLDNEKQPVEDVVPKKRGILSIFTGKTPPPIPEDPGPYPEYNVSFLSRYTFQWIWPLLSVCIFALIGTLDADL